MSDAKLAQCAVRLHDAIDDAGLTMPPCVREPYMRLRAALEEAGAMRCITPRLGDEDSVESYVKAAIAGLAHLPAFTVADVVSVVMRSTGGALSSPSRCAATRSRRPCGRWLAMREVFSPNTSLACGP